MNKVCRRDPISAFVSIYQQSIHLFTIVIGTLGSDNGLSQITIRPWAISDVLDELKEHSLIPWGTSQVFIDTFFRYVSDREILFIKRNERRFWTHTSAREDAESALTHLMNLEEGVAGAGR